MDQGHTQPVNGRAGTGTQRVLAPRSTSDTTPGPGRRTRGRGGLECGLGCAPEPRCREGGDGVGLPPRHAPVTACACLSRFWGHLWGHRGQIDRSCPAASRSEAPVECQAWAWGHPPGPGAGAAGARWSSVVVISSWPGVGVLAAFKCPPPFGLPSREARAQRPRDRQTGGSREQGQGAGATGAWVLFQLCPEGASGKGPHVPRFPHLSDGDEMTGLFRGLGSAAPGGAGRFPFLGKAGGKVPAPGDGPGREAPAPAGPGPRGHC